MNTGFPRNPSHPRSHSRPNVPSTRSESGEPEVQSTLLVFVLYEQVASSFPNRESSLTYCKTLCRIFSFRPLVRLST